MERAHSKNLSFKILSEAISKHPPRKLLSLLEDQKLFFGFLKLFICNFDKDLGTKEADLAYLQKMKNFVQEIVFVDQKEIKVIIYLLYINI